MGMIVLGSFRIRFGDAILLGSLAVLASVMAAPSVYCAEEYVYYGVVPGRIHYAKPKAAHAGMSQYDPSSGWEIDPGSVASIGLVSIVASRDETHVEVCTLPDKMVASSAELGAMEKLFVSLPNGSIFKVVSNHLVSVMLLGGNVGGKELNPDADEGPVPTTFFTAADGGYVGEEFVFVASQALTGSPYRILALEDAEVTITREDDSMQSFRLGANTYKELQLAAFRAYKVESTGHIMIQSGGPGSYSFFVPSVDGGFKGKRFYSVSTEVWSVAWPHDYGFRISAAADTEVTVWDVKYKRKALEVEVKGGTGVSMKPKGEVIFVESDEAVTLEFMHNGTVETDFTYGAGVAYMGVRANEETSFFLPTNSSNEAYVFAQEDTLVRIDDVPMTIMADSYLVFTVPGTHRIQADKNVAVQVVHWALVPECQGIDSFGVVIPCVQKVSMVPPVTLTPLAGEGFPTTYAVMGLAVAAAGATTILLVMRRRK